MRVFHDRLIDDTDREYLKGVLAEMLPDFGVTVEDTLNLERLIFCDFWAGKDVDPRHYIQVPDLKKLGEMMYEF